MVSLISIGLIVGMLTTGSINTISKKLQFQIATMGLCEVHTFSKPWFQTACMFAGESMCLLFYLVLNMRKTPEKANPDEPRLSFPKKCMLFALLASCDLAGTALAGIGLLFTFASVYQMLRGSIIIFTGLWSVLFLHRKLERFRWTAIGITVVGLLLVGLSGVLAQTKASPPWTMQLLGCLLIVAGQLANSTQMIIEEKNLKGYKMNPLVVVGSEGVFGFLMTVSVALPIVTSIPGADCGSYENAIDALMMLGHNGFLVGMFLTYWLSIAFYNGLSLTVAKRLTSVHRTLVDACRTLFVWSFQLLLYYTTDGQFGEPWTQWSWLQVLGFAFLVAGTLTYNHVIPLERCFGPAWAPFPAAPAAPVAPSPAKEEERSPLLAEEGVAIAAAGSAEPGAP